MKITKVAKYIIANDRYSGQKLCHLVGLTESEFIEEFLTSIDKIGLTEDEMIELALKLENTKMNKAVSKRISPVKSKQFFGEQVAPMASFTSTANVANYPVPIGMKPGSAKKTKMLRRKFPKK